ncbi:Uncharacterised protein [Klebsiella pneumoniae]|nr:Uncharacterised protein [Klebsiella pneumoniae]
MLNPQREDGRVLNGHKGAAQGQGQQTDVAAAEGGEQAEQHGDKRIDSEHVVRREAADKPGAGKTADKEADHGGGQVVGGETGRHARDLFDSVANQVAPAGGLRADVAELGQYRPAPVADAHQARQRGEKSALRAVAVVIALQGGEAGADDQQGDQQDNGHDNHIGGLYRQDQTVLPGAELFRRHFIQHLLRLMRDVRQNKTLAKYHGNNGAE